MSRGESSRVMPSGDVGDSVSSAASTSTRKRGPTRGVGNFGQKIGQKMSLDWNKYNQAIGENASRFSQLLGTIVRHSGYAPLQYKKWADIPKHSKDSLWQVVKNKTEMDDSKKKWVMQRMSARYRDWKNDLKKDYKKYETDEERLLHIPTGVSKADWTWLVHYWSTPEAQVISKRNSKNRKNQVIKHTGGTKSCAQYWSEMAKGKEDGSLPTRAEVFKKIHTRKNGSYSDPKSAELINNMIKKHKDSGGSDSTPISEKIFTEEMGPERHGRVRTYGLGLTPSSVFTSTSNSSRSSTYAEMQSQLNEMQNTQVERDRQYEERIAELQNMQMERDRQHEERIAELQREMQLQMQIQMQMQMQMQREIHSQVQSQVQEHIALYFRTVFPNSHLPSQ